MERLTFEGNFCDIAQCRELPCPYDGNCTQKQVWERLKAYEDSRLSPQACAEAREIEETLSGYPDMRSALRPATAATSQWMAQSWTTSLQALAATPSASQISMARPTAGGSAPHTMVTHSVCGTLTPPDVTIDSPPTLHMVSAPQSFSPVI